MLITVHNSILLKKLCECTGKKKAYCKICFAIFSKSSIINILHL